MGLISDDSWIWGELCPMQSCAHSLRDHTIREGGVKQQFGCKNCTCNMYVKTTVNILVVKRKEASLASGTTMQEHPPVPIVVPEDLFATVVGYEDLKSLMKRGLSSANPVHFLLVGPPASAKSLFLMELGRLPGAHYAVGSGVSKAGIRQLLIKQEPKLLLIDEMDKVHKDDLSVLLSLMENGLVTETLYGRHGKFWRDARVFAAANRLASVPEELLSRFWRFDLPLTTRKPSSR